MPAFTFEKISPPARRGATAPGTKPAVNTPIANKKQRGLIVQIIDRFAEVRIKRSLREEKGPSVRPTKP